MVNAGARVRDRVRARATVWVMINVRASAGFRI